MRVKEATVDPGNTPLGAACGLQRRVGRLGTGQRLDIGLGPQCASIHWSRGAGRGDGLPARTAWQPGKQERHRAVLHGQQD